MKARIFTNILENKKEIQQLETAELKAILQEFPYFQAARALYLKGLKNQDSFKYNNELKVTAAYTTDRTILFNYITTPNFNHKNENIHQQISKKISEATPTIKTQKQLAVIIDDNKEPEEAAEKLKIGKPLSFSTNENYSFNQWLQLSTKKPIVRKVKKVEGKQNEKSVIIETFIKNNPKIEPIEKGKIVAVPVSRNTQDTALMTETLAKVYLEQKKYENAIQAYRILSLKYPEKSGFFADQIKRIQIIQKNKL
ncbi:MAG: hypothetical protein ACWIPJ_01470 [Polaribacter sp.]